MWNIELRIEWRSAPFCFGNVMFRHYQQAIFALQLTAGSRDASQSAASKEFLSMVDGLREKAIMKARMLLPQSLQKIRINCTTPESTSRFREISSFDWARFTRGGVQISIH